jgi:hypothetical protein
MAAQDLRGTIIDCEVFSRWWYIWQTRITLHVVLCATSRLVELQKLVEQNKISRLSVD